MASQPEAVYEDLEVQTEWVHEALQDTLIAYLLGFQKEQLKVQLTTGGNLRITGECPIGGNKFSRFYKEVPIPSNCNQNQIRANFSGGMLHIKLPKWIVPADEEPEQAKPSAQVPKSDQTPQPPRPADASRKQSDGPEQAVQEAPPMDTMEKQAGDKTDGQAKEADNVEEKAPDKEKEMEDKSNASNGSEKPSVKEKNGWDQEEKTSSSEKHEKLGDSVEDAAEKEAVETKKLDETDKYQLANMVSLYKQVLDGLAMELKNPRKIMNMVLVVLSLVAFAVYLRNAIRYLSNY